MRSSFLLLLAFAGGPALAAPLSEAEVAELQIPVVKADLGPLVDRVPLFGQIHLHPERALHLHPRFAGVVRDVSRSAGDIVRAGDVLARIENNVGVQTYELRTSIDGVVVERRLAVGQSVDEELEAFTVANTRVVIATLVVYQRDFAKLKIGQSVEIRGAVFPTTQAAPITHIAPILDDATRTAEVRVTLENPQDSWRPGQFVHGDVSIGETTAVVRLPLETLGEASYGPATIYARNAKGAFEAHRITVGRLDGRFAEVTSGLTAGTDVLAQPANTVERHLRALQKKKKKAEAEEKHDDHK